MAAYVVWNKMSFFITLARRAFRKSKESYVSSHSYSTYRYTFDAAYAEKYTYI